MLQCVWEGFQGDFSSFRQLSPETPHGCCASLLCLDLWVATSLSYHVVSVVDGVSSCSCPGYWTHNEKYLSTSGPSVRAKKLSASIRSLLGEIDESDNPPSDVEVSVTISVDHERDPSLPAVRKPRSVLPAAVQESIESSSDDEPSVSSMQRQGSRIGTLPVVFNLARHGPTSKKNLQELVDVLQANPCSHLPSIRGQLWRLEFAKGRASTCRGCRGAIDRHGPRPSWTNSSHELKKQIVGSYAGLWHITRGILLSKIQSSRSVFDELVWRTFP